MRTLETDVLIIGSGLAGLRAAIEAAKQGVNTTVISKGVGSNTALGGGGFNLATSEFGVEDHIRATLSSGKNLNDRELVRELAVKGAKEAEFLRGIGVDLISQQYGLFVDRRSFPSKMLGGRIIVRKLIEEASKYDQIQFISHFFVYKILLVDNQVTGVVGFNKDGHSCLISSKATILATGGGGGIYERNDNHKRILGDGYALAMEIGLPLFDMEFVQFVPFAVAEPRLPQILIYPPYPKEAKLLDAHGNDFLKKYKINMDLNELILRSRDEISCLVYKESERGKVFMDFTNVPNDKWEHYPLNLFPKQRFNFREKPFQIAPVTHFFMGGIKIRPSGETDRKGFFAAGEVTAGVHGANRMGGNAFTECLVFGANSGLSASKYSKNITLKRPSFTEECLKPLIQGEGSSDIRSEILKLLKSIREIAWRYAGPVRNGIAMKEALSLLERLKNDLEDLKVRNTTELISKKEVENSLLVMKAILVSSLAREESRGAFQREDYPQEDGSKFPKRISIKMSDKAKDLEVPQVFSHPGEIRENSLE
jgi:fumarate reductase (CoM/CoB) subunit A